MGIDARTGDPVHQGVTAGESTSPALPITIE
jgi:hypothetical protein